MKRPMASTRVAAADKEKLNQDIRAHGLERNRIRPVEPREETHEIKFQQPQNERPSPERAGVLHLNDGLPDLDGLGFVWDLGDGHLERPAQLVGVRVRRFGVYELHRILRIYGRERGRRDQGESKGQSNDRQPIARIGAHDNHLAE